MSWDSSRWAKLHSEFGIPKLTTTSDNFPRVYSAVSIYLSSRRARLIIINDIFDPQQTYAGLPVMAYDCSVMCMQRSILGFSTSTGDIFITGST